MPRSWLLIILLAAGCTSSVTPTTSVDAAAVAGGTLRVGIWVEDPANTEWRTLFLDPQIYFWHPLVRCCLHRTLLSYPGVALPDGGALLQPDLADALPTVSPDGLTWTFHLRDGVRYAPPFEDREIVARDFITALERAIRVGEVPYPDVIDGVRAFRKGTAETIAGVHAPDDRTLVFRLTAPVGDFGHRVAMAYLTPIPLEALAVHDAEYAGFLVASGPYMIEGSENLDHSDPSAEPVWKDDPVGQMSLVRNPSWTSDLDGLRPAYVDRIDFVPVADRAHALTAIEAGDIDVMLDPLLPSSRNEAAADPELRGRLREAALTRLFYIPLNVAQPPFDDPNVRRAVNAVVDRQALSTTFDPIRGSAFRPAAHAFPDVAVAGLLQEYAPYGGRDGAGDLDRARELMAASAYDANGDGRCDGDACSVTGNRYGSTSDAAIEIIESNLSELGISVTWVDDPFMGDPTAHIALAAIAGWGSDYPSGSDFIGLITAPGGPDSLNLSLIGASPDQLASWGYATDAVPSVDDKVGACSSIRGSAAFACWAELDQILTEQVVAWVPIATSVGAWVISERVDRFDISGSEATPALDRVSVRPGTER